MSAIPSPGPTVANGAWAQSLGTHPCLLGPRQFLEQRRARRPEFYQRMKSHSPQDWLEGVKHRIGYNDLLAAGIVHALEGLPRERVQPYVNKALAIAERGPTNNHQDSWVDMEQAVLAFDFFHDLISAEQRRTIVTYLEGQLAAFTTDETAFHNSTASKFLCYLRVAYGIWGESPKGKAFRDHAIGKLYESLLVPVFREFGAGGGWTECGWYQRHSLWHLVQGLELARRFEGYDGYQLCPEFYYQRLAYEMHQPYPGLWQRGVERYSSEGDGQQIYSEFMEFPRLMRTVIAEYFRGSELSRVTMSRRREGTSDHVRLFDFLYEEEPETALDPAEAKLPLAHLAKDVGRLYARSDWSADATWLRFECGPWWTQHQHFEAGNFEIFRRDILAAESGEYCGWNDEYATNWLIRTIAHNCILIHQEGETWEVSRNGRRPGLANDGGQGTRSIATQDLAGWREQGMERARGSIAAYINQPRLMYVAGDATATYAPSKAKQVLRQIVFLRPHLFVMLDTVISTKAEYEKTWLLHCQNEPAIEGNRMAIANGAGRLEVQTLLPVKAQIGKVHGAEYGGKRYVAKSSYHPAELLPQWRVEVRPGEAQCADQFLHVLSTDGPVEAELCREGKMVGAKGSMPVAWQVLLNPDGGGVVRIGKEQIELRNAVVTGPYES